MKQTPQELEGDTRKRSLSAQAPRTAGGRTGIPRPPHRRLWLLSGKTASWVSQATAPQSSEARGIETALPALGLPLREPPSEVRRDPNPGEGVSNQTQGARHRGQATARPVLAHTTGWRPGVHEGHGPPESAAGGFLPGRLCVRADVHTAELTHPSQEPSGLCFRRQNSRACSRVSLQHRGRPGNIPARQQFIESHPPMVSESMSIVSL